MKLFYSPEYVAAVESFDTTRKSGWIAKSLVSDPIAGVEVVAPVSLTFEEVAEVHGARYVEAVRSGEPRDLAQSQGFDWDPGMWRMVTTSNGGAVEAALTAMSDGVAGSLSSGLHHARRDEGLGFCTFNGLVIAAKRALSAGARSVLILDLDAHCGGGTQSLIHGDDRIWQVDVSVSDFDCYEATRPNFLKIVNKGEEYLETVRRCLDDVDLSSQKPTLCIYNAGMDPDERCGIGGLIGINEAILTQREEIVFRWCANRRIPVAFVIAGGYAQGALGNQELVRLHRLTVSTAAMHYDEGFTEHR